MQRLLGAAPSLPLGLQAAVVFRHKSPHRPRLEHGGALQSSAKRRSLGLIRDPSDEQSRGRGGTSDELYIRRQSLSESGWKTSGMHTGLTRPSHMLSEIFDWHRSSHGNPPHGNDRGVTTAAVTCPYTPSHIPAGAMSIICTHLTGSWKASASN